MSALITIPVGVVVERLKAQSHWIDFVWRAANVLEGVPETPAWTLLEGDKERALFYAGAADVSLYTSDTAHYRENLATGFPKLWIVLRPTGVEPPFDLVTVTADPFEGEGMTEGATDLIETVPMPDSIKVVLEDFIAEHHVEQPFFKRKRDKANLDAFARRPGGREEKKS
jgi:hypothetical protein